MDETRSYSLATELECVECNSRFPFNLSAYVCQHCSGNLFVNYDYVKAKEALERELAGRQSGSSLWRYAALLPVNGESDLMLRVGGTPLYKADGDFSVELLLKDEAVNPSGSIKDRASAVAVACALADARREIAVASTGNAACSLACLGASTELNVKVYVPPSAPEEKLIQMRMYGAEVCIVKETYDDAFRRCRDDCEANTLCVNRNTGFNPFTREGKKTCSFEIWEQLDRQIPEWVIVPVGDGNVISGIWKGFGELARMGLASRVPRLVAAQSEKSNVISSCFRSAKTSAECQTSPITAGGIADSLRVGSPADETAAVQALQESLGLAVELDDDSILRAMCELAGNWGLFAEPAAAASYACFQKMYKEGHFSQGDRVVCLLTGSGLKDTAAAELAMEKLRKVTHQVEPSPRTDPAPSKEVAKHNRRLS